MKRVWCTTIRESCDPPPPDRNYLAFAPEGVMASTTPYSQGFRFLCRHSRRRLGSPWVGPINAALKRLKLATVTPGATVTSTFSTSSDDDDSYSVDDSVDADDSPFFGTLLFPCILLQLISIPLQ